MACNICRVGDGLHELPFLRRCSPFQSGIKPPAGVDKTRTCADGRFRIDLGIVLRRPEINASACCKPPVTTDGVRKMPAHPWYLLPNPQTRPLSGAPDFSSRDMLLKGTVVALIALAPSLTVFAVSWIILDDLLYAAAIGAAVHLVSMVVSFKISKRIFGRS